MRQVWQEGTSTGSGLLCTGPQSEVGSVLEVTFSAFTAEWEFRLGQNNGANDLTTGNLRRQKHVPSRKLIRIGEFHELTASTDICPFILHLFDLALVHQPFRPGEYPLCGVCGYGGRSGKLTLGQAENGSHPLEVANNRTP
jgi:hypothetical protein